ncbi:MAG: flagellar hook-associated protein FlgL [Clostridiales bacterium]|jgi:flagellar hook-associated protein 3 FlgL|nr:flagellar hook-associated protein FlgL [Clostridiales bacterium]
MRITNQSILHNYLNNLNKNLANLSRYQDQMSSGKEVRRPSDDPFAVTRSMSLYTSLNQNAQYLRNIEDSLGWVDMTDSALGHLGDIMHRLRELVVKGATGSLADADRNAIKDEVIQLVGQLAQIANTNYDGRYIFGGQDTTKPPFEVDGYQLIYTGASGQDKEMLTREISQNVVMEINVPGSWLISGKAGQALSDDLPSVLNEIVLSLENADTDALGGKLLEQLDKHIDNILALRSEMGAKYNRLEAAKQKNEEETFNMKELLSKTEDIDFAEKIMEYSMMANVYYASLSMGARILMPSLLNFLK